MALDITHLTGRAVLAPMAGVADRAMREVCRLFGAAFVVGELASSKGIFMNDRKSAELLSVSDAERPMGVQLFGNDPLTMANAAQTAMRWNPDFIDVNMGCPVPKVNAGGGGCSLMKSPALAAQIVEEMVRAVPVPVTVKIRAGWDDAHLNAVEVAQRCEQAGASLITVHGRTRVQMYAPPANLDIIRAVKQAVSVPVIGNGDIATPADAAAMLEHTGCDVVMVGRAARGAPWLFAQISAYLRDGTVLPQPPVCERMRVMLDQVGRMVRYKGEDIAMREARKQSAWYLRGFVGAAAFRSRCGSLTTFSQLEELAFAVCCEIGS